MLDHAHQKFGWPSPEQVLNPPGSGPSIYARLAREKLEGALRRREDGDRVNEPRLLQDALGFARALEAVFVHGLVAAGHDVKQEHGREEATQVKVNPADPEYPADLFLCGHAFRFLPSLDCGDLVGRSRFGQSNCRTSG